MAHEKDIIISYFDGALPEVSEQADGEIIKAAVLSIESRGRNPKHAKLIEMGVVVLELEKETSKITKVIEKHHWFQDPEDDESIDEVFTKRTGITSEMVQGKSIDAREFEAIIEAVDVFIAYNAGYVRPILQEQFPSLERSIFACVRNQIDWTSKGYESRALGHLTRDHGWYSDQERALEQCGVLVKLLSEKQEIEGQEQTYLHELVGRAEEPLITIEAKVQMKQKYLMKKERFRWDPRERAFLRCMGTSTLERVRKSLDARGFRGELIERDRLPASERFK